MWARVARFEGDPATLDERVEKLKAAADSGAFPDELADARFLLLVEPRVRAERSESRCFRAEEAMRKGDAAMNAGPGEAGSRSAVEFYEVPIALNM